jgi:hypothetical protein
MSKVNSSDLSGQLLVSRQDAARLLGNVSVATCIRLEKAGILQPVSLNPKSSTSQKFYTQDNVLSVAAQKDAGSVRARMSTHGK